jgi:hypothetical protein
MEALAGAGLISGIIVICYFIALFIWGLPRFLLNFVMRTLP